MDQSFHHMQGIPKGLLTYMEGQRLGKLSGVTELFCCFNCRIAVLSGCCREASLLLFSHVL